MRLGRVVVVGGGGGWWWGGGDPPPSVSGQVVSLNVVLAHCDVLCSVYNALNNQLISHASVMPQPWISSESSEPCLSHGKPMETHGN